MKRFSFILAIFLCAGFLTAGITQQMQSVAGKKRAGGATPIAAVGTPTTGQTTFGANATSVTFSNTVPSGANYLYVGVLISDATATCTGVTYNGAAMTSIGSTRGNTLQYVHLWGLTAPTVGTANVVVTASATTVIQAGAASFSGVNQTTPTSGFQTSVEFFSDVSKAFTATTSDMVVDFVHYGGGSNPAAGGSQTILWQPAPQNQGWGASYQQASNPTMAWTTSANTATWTGVILKP